MPKRLLLSEARREGSTLQAETRCEVTARLSFVPATERDFAFMRSLEATMSRAFAESLFSLVRVK